MLRMNMDIFNPEEVIEVKNIATNEDFKIVNSC